VAQHRRSRYDRAWDSFVRWLAHTKYAVRGYLDGLRGIPLIADGTAHASPTLRRLADEVTAEREATQALGRKWTTPERMELAQLIAAGGRQDRAAQRLATMTERLEEIEATGPQSGRRFGENQLPNEIVASRRQREHERRVKQARKRLEDGRTELSELMSAQRRLETSIEEQLKQSDSQARVVGRAQQSRATTYLNGALRTHPERPLLCAETPQLMPWAPASAYNHTNTDQRKDHS
jgi:hypothetical protein